MDAFEQLVADLFWADGYWVRNSVKVDLTREDKHAIGKHSSPRWEIDLVVYQPVKNELLVLECKSYFDSGGVHAAHLLPGAKLAHRYKLFHDAMLRDTVLYRLKDQFVQAGYCHRDAEVRLGLVYGHATKGNAERLEHIFREGNWRLFDANWLRTHLVQLSHAGYENSTAAVVAKVLNRGNASESRASTLGMRERIHPTLNGGRAP